MRHFNVIRKRQTYDDPIAGEAIPDFFTAR